MMMTNNCTNCGCSKPKCGCQDTILTTPAPCPTPVGCPNPEPCSEVLDAQCIIYTGVDLVCGPDVIIASGTSVAQAFADLILYLQTNGVLFCEPIVCSSPYTYITNAVLANVPALDPAASFVSFLETSIVLPNGPTGICCPSCGPYVLAGIVPFSKYFEAITTDINCCSNIYASILTTATYDTLTGGTLLPCDNGFSTAVIDLANLTGNPLGVASNAIIEIGSLNPDGTTNVPDFTTMIDAFIAADPATTYLEIVQIMQRQGIVVHCCNDKIFIGSIENYLIWIAGGPCNPPVL